jgi:hypothetical protein
MAKHWQAIHNAVAIGDKLIGSLSPLRPLTAAECNVLAASQTMLATLRETDKALAKPNPDIASIRKAIAVAVAPAEGKAPAA